MAGPSQPPFVLSDAEQHKARIIDRALQQVVSGKPIAATKQDARTAGYEAGYEDAAKAMGFGKGEDINGFVERLKKLPPELGRQLARERLAHADQRLASLNKERDARKKEVAFGERLEAAIEWVERVLSQEPPKGLAYRPDLTALHAHYLVSDLQFDIIRKEQEGDISGEHISRAEKFSFCGAELHRGFADLAAFGADLRAKDLFRLPYSSCWFEAAIEDGLLGIYANEEWPNIRTFLLYGPTRTWVPIIPVVLDSAQEPWVVGQFESC